MYVYVYIPDQCQLAMSICWNEPDRSDILYRLSYNLLPDFCYFLDIATKLNTTSGFFLCNYYYNIYTPD